jgi:hypothetical protein
MCDTTLDERNAHYARKEVTNMATKTPQALTPTQIASQLAGDENAAQVAKSFVRPYLRKHFTRSKEAKGTAWYLTADQVKAIRDAFKARQAGKA